MAATNFTPISLYYSTTAAATPSSGNLVAGELALNTLDEKLYFKNSTGTVKLLASNAGSAGSVTSVAATVPTFLSIAGSPITTSGTLAITLSGTALPVANGGTGLTSGTSGGILAYTATGTLASSGVLAQYGVVIGGGAGVAPTSTAVGTATHVLTSNGAGVAPTFQAPAASGVTTITFGSTGLTPATATSGAVTVAGTLAPANGGTGVSNNAAMTVTGSGNFAYTRTLTGTTNVTLPTTGTLATLAGSETFTNKTLTNPTVTNYVETLVAIGNSGTTQTLSLTSGTVQTVTMTGNCTFTMPTATAGKSFILICTQDATGSRTATFTSVKFPGGTAPTLTTTATTGVDILTFVANGTSWFGTYAQAFA
jgi:hypothetical protein